MAESNNADQAVLVHLKLSDEGFGTDVDRAAAYELEDALMHTVESLKVGEFDGNEFGQGEVVFFMYGPNSDKIYTAIEPVLRKRALKLPCFVIKRYGPPGSPKVKITL